ncbi:hypothetical protein DXG01_013150 [Tephrocybe rancida]|nr:hypothetical protein DXG01_013150 [Tephrocybe rancida]
MDNLRTVEEHAAGLSNDIVLSAVEAQHARTLINKLETESQTFQAEILRLALLHDKVSARITKCCVALAPHKRAPNEILSKIFVYAVPREGTAYPFPNNSSFPWPLRWVCSRWRQVALATHALWNDVVIDMQGVPNFFQSQYVVPFASSILLPQGSMSLTFKSKYEVVPAMNILLRPNMKRLVNITLKVPALSLEVCLDIPPRAFTSTRSLVLTLTDNDKLGYHRRDTLKGFLALFSRLSNLVLKIEGTPGAYLYDLSDAVLNSGCLTESLAKIYMHHFDNVDISVFDRILQRCVNMVDIRVSLIRPEEHTQSYNFKKLSFPRPLKKIYFTGKYMPSDVQILQLGVPWSQLECFWLDNPLVRILRGSPFLESFTVGDISDEDHVIDSLILPKLNFLEVRTRRNGPNFPSTQIAELIHRSGCTLSRVVFQPYVWVLGMRELLSHIPTVKEVTIDGVNIDLQTLEAIEENQLLPRLEVLDCEIKHDSLPAFVTMLRRRLQFKEGEGTPSWALLKAHAKFVPLNGRRRRPTDEEAALVQERLTGYASFVDIDYVRKS